MHFIAIQNTYHHVELSIYRDAQNIGGAQLDKNHASRDLVITLADALASCSTALTECAFIAVNQGPGPFTTLRTVIASMNGLSFASSIPLVGVDGLQAFAREHRDPTWQLTVYLLNAFGNDVYFYVTGEDKPRVGYQNIRLFLDELAEKYPASALRFMGNGADLFGPQIKQTFDSRAYIPEPNPQTCSLATIAQMGREQWDKKINVHTQLMPLYLKKHPCELT